MPSVKELEQKPTLRGLLLGRAVTRAHVVQDMAVTLLLKPLGLTRAQMGVLAHTIDGSKTMNALAARMWCDGSNLTGVVDRLCAAGLVERERDRGDRRVVRVKATQSGEAKQAEIHEAVPRFHRRAAERLTKREQITLLKLLEKYMEGAEDVLDELSTGSRARMREEPQTDATKELQLV